MRLGIARMAMRLAMRAMGQRRAAWAAAMMAEFDAAVADGRPLAFAGGCLIGALRDLPAHDEGRFALASHAMAWGLILPSAALLLTGGLAGYPFLGAAGGDLEAVLPGRGGRVLLLNAGNMMSAPSFALLVSMLSVVHCLLAWWLLERDWKRLGATARFGAAVMTTLMIVSAVTALGTASMILPMLWITVELLALGLLVEWHCRTIEPEMTWAGPLVG